MKSTYRVSFLSALLLCGFLVAASGAAVKKRAGTQRLIPGPAKSAAPASAPPEAQPGTRVVQYGDKDVVKVNTKLRYTTLIVLPKNEQILDFTCGDQAYWVVNGN